MSESTTLQGLRENLRQGLESLESGRFGDADDALGRAIEQRPRLAKLWLLRGMARARLRRGGEAREDARRAVSLSPEDPELLQQAARVLHAGGHEMDSLQCLERASERSPRDAALHERLFEAYMALGWYREAIGAIDVAIEHASDKSAPVQRAASALFYDLGDAQMAVEYLERQFEPGSGSPDVWLVRADALGALGRFSEGLASVTEALRVAPPTAEVRLAAARRQISLGDPAAAIENTHLAVELAPNAVDALFATAELSLWRGDDAAASSTAERALRLAPEHAGALAIRGALHVRAGRLDDAERALEAALAHEHGNPSALAWRGELRRAQGRFAEAVVDIDMALMNLPSYSVILETLRLLTVMAKQPEMTGPMDRDAFEELVRIFAPVLPDPSEADRCTGRPDAVRKLLTDALAAFGGNRSAFATWVPVGEAVGEITGLPLSPDRVHSRFASRKIQELVRTRDRADLMQRFDALAEARPGEPIIDCYRGETLFWLGDYDASAEAFDRALEITEKVRWGYAGKCALAVVAEDYEGCIEWARIGAEAFPPPGRTLYAYRGEAYRRLGRLDEALADTRKMLGITPGRIASWINLALIESQLGDDSRLAPTYVRLRRRARGFVWDAEREVGTVEIGTVEIGAVEIGAAPPPEAIARLFEHMLTMMRGNRCSDFVTYFTADGKIRFVPPTDGPVFNNNNYGDDDVDPAEATQVRDGEYSIQPV